MFEDKWGEISHHLIPEVVICYHVNLCSHKLHYKVFITLQYNTDYFILRPQIATQFPNECIARVLTLVQLASFVLLPVNSPRFSQLVFFKRRMKKKKKKNEKKRKKAGEKSEELREDREKKIDKHQE